MKFSVTLVCEKGCKLSKIQREKQTPIIGDLQLVVWSERQGDTKPMRYAELTGPKYSQLPYPLTAKLWEPTMMAMKADYFLLRGFERVTVQGANGGSEICEYAQGWVVRAVEPVLRSFPER